jgi:hypothetical protein
MIDVKIFPGDVAVVIRSRAPVHRSIVPAIVDEEPTVKRLNRRSGNLIPHNENAKLPAFLIADGVVRPSGDQRFALPTPATPYELVCVDLGSVETYDPTAGEGFPSR